MGTALPTPPPPPRSYPAIIELTRRLNRQYASARETQLATRAILNSLFPSWLPGAFSVMFSRPLPALSCRLNAFATALTCQWLMGPCKVNDAEIDGGQVGGRRAAVPGQGRASEGGGALSHHRAWRQEPAAVPARRWALPACCWHAAADSPLPLQTHRHIHPIPVDVTSAQVGTGMGVLVERCRYLEEAGCASICINSCKVPTQVRACAAPAVARRCGGAECGPARFGGARRSSPFGKKESFRTLQPAAHVPSLLNQLSGALPSLTGLTRRSFLRRTWGCR